MLRRTSLLQIDGQPLPEPTAAADIRFSDVESDDSGADEMGVYHREVLRFGVLSCTLTYGYLSSPIRGTWIEIARCQHCGAPSWPFPTRTQIQTLLAEIGTARSSSRN